MAASHGMRVSATWLRRERRARILPVSSTTTASAPSRTRGDGMAARLRSAAIVAIGSGIAGAVVGGLGSRLAMRLAALAAPEVRGAVTENGAIVGEITLAGTIALMVFAGVASTALGAGAFVVVKPWLPERTVPRGVAFGGFLLATMGSSVVDAGNADFMILGDRFLNVTIFSALFLAFGLVASASFTALEARVPEAAALSPRMWAVSAVCALPLIPGVIGVAFGFGPRLGVPLLAASAAMLAVPSVERRGRHGLAQLLRVGATAGMLVVVGLAGADYVDSVITIL
ncbi:MAG TPA: hypothetical protein VFW51_04815 [Actinomycetota bacterium]|nr:hypothetical protein [Actinomycetota bacterium]